MLAHRFMIEKLLHCAVINTNIVVEKSIDSKFEGDCGERPLRVFLKHWNEPIHLERLNILVTELP